MVVVENFKGSREIPNSKRDKITIVNALNDSIDIIPIIAAREHLGFYEIRDNIIPRLDRKAYVRGFIDGRLKSFAKIFNEINKVKVRKVKEETIDIQYSIKAKNWLNKFRGVATKYLNNYLSWFSFLFIAHRLSKTSRIVDLFMEFATKNLSITKKQIQDRKVEFI